jgi:hypothetical protein
MTYKLGQRVRPRRYRKCIPIVLSLLVGLVLGVALADVSNARGSSPVGLQLSTVAKKRLLFHTSGSAAKPLVRHTSAVAPPAAAVSVTVQKQNVLQGLSCGVLPPKHVGLATSVSPELRKLSQYEQLCGGALAARTSFFVPTPDTVAAASGDASDVATTLKEYSRLGVAPLVFMEPDTDAGVDLDLVQYQNGAYNAALNAYFADLKADGITDSMMGIWVLIPEGNIPGWGSVDPTTFAADVTITAQYQKQYFPDSQSAVLLDSESYPSASSWSNGAYTSLVPYVQGIPKGLINSFGLEGFPWATPANQPGPEEYNPDVYLRTDLAAAAARSLGVTSIWLNTGTFHQMYTQDAAETVTMTPLQRQAILAEVVVQAKALQQQGFTVAVHLFAQNKAATSEAIDWSYWQTNPGDEPDSEVLTTFVHNLNAANIPFWLFDTYDQ